MNINKKYAAITFTLLHILISCQKDPGENKYKVPKFESNQSEFADDVIPAKAGISLPPRLIIIILFVTIVTF